MRMNLPEDTRVEIVAHYRKHRDTYARIWGKLDTINEKFIGADEDARIAYLKLSYINSLISVQTPLHIHEEALTRVMNGEGWGESLASVNYNVQKRKFGKRTLADDEIWSDMATLLPSKVDKAHKEGVDRLQYVGTVKVPFTLANLGFTEKMCIDANVVRVMGMDSNPTTVVVERYENICQEIRDYFPTLSQEIDPYHLQWVLFDYQRYNRTNMSEVQKSRSRAAYQVTKHDSWFDAVSKPWWEISEAIDSLD